MMHAILPSQTPLWFYNQVRNGGPWDYKQSGYEPFGNFNYGATGQRAGFSWPVIAGGSVYAHFGAHRWNGLRPGNLANEISDQGYVWDGYRYGQNRCR